MPVLLRQFSEYTAFGLIYYRATIPNRQFRLPNYLRFSQNWLSSKSFCAFSLVQGQCDAGRGCTSIGSGRGRSNPQANISRKRAFCGSRYTPYIHEQTLQTREQICQNMGGAHFLSITRRNTFQPPDLWATRQNTTNESNVLLELGLSILSFSVCMRVKGLLLAGVYVCHLSYAAQFPRVNTCSYILKVHRLGNFRCRGCRIDRVQHTNPCLL